VREGNGSSGGGQRWGSSGENVACC
jgi:hypothetical protein